MKNVCTCVYEDFRLTIIDCNFISTNFQNDLVKNQFYAEIMKMKSILFSDNFSSYFFLIVCETFEKGSRI